MSRPPRSVDLTGHAFGRLLVLERAPREGASTGARWFCCCSCGNKTVTPGRHLRIGKARSCGCYQKEVASETAKTMGSGSITHGDTINGVPTPEYQAWNAMLNRCRNENVACFPEYGGRGIKVCDQWHHYENFIADMGRRPSPKHSLDRYPNNDGDYEPANCRWATKAEQEYNKRSTKWIEYQGRRITLLEASKISGVGVDGLRRRINRGWSSSRAIETPQQGRGT